MNTLNKNGPKDIPVAVTCGIWLIQSILGIVVGIYCASRAAASVESWKTVVWIAAFFVSAGITGLVFFILVTSIAWLVFRDS